MRVTPWQVHIASSNSSYLFNIGNFVCSEKERPQKTNAATIEGNNKNVLISWLSHIGDSRVFQREHRVRQ